LFLLNKRETNEWNTECKEVFLSMYFSARLFFTFHETCKLGSHPITCNGSYIYEYI